MKASAGAFGPHTTVSFVRFSSSRPAALKVGGAYNQVMQEDPGEILKAALSLPAEARAALADSLRRGYAAASTDTGHTGSDASFASGHPEKLIDFGYRAVHETAVQAKATAKALYGSAPRLSYFNGCSGGGRQAFMEAQRFPEDFDGIIAGAPGYNRTDVAFQTISDESSPAARLSFDARIVLPFEATSCSDVSALPQRFSVSIV